MYSCFKVRLLPPQPKASVGLAPQLKVLCSDKRIVRIMDFDFSVLMERI